MKAIKVDDVKEMQSQIGFCDADSDTDIAFSNGMLRAVTELQKNAIEIGWQDLTDENMPDEGVEVTLRTKASPLYVDTIYKGRWGTGHTPEQILILPEEGTE